jgi:hypothetical protein
MQTGLEWPAVAVVDPANTGELTTNILALLQRLQIQR